MNTDVTIEGGGEVQMQNSRISNILTQLGSLVHFCERENIVDGAK